MSSAGNDRRGWVDVHLSQQSVVVDYGAGEAFWRRGDLDIEHALEALADEFKASGAVRRANFWLSASLCRPVHVPAVAGIASARERERIARTMATSRCGLPAPCRVWVDTTNGQGDAMAVVVEERVLALIERAMMACKVRVMSLQPWWTQVLSCALAVHEGMGALGVWEDDTLLLMTGAERSFSSVQILDQVVDEDEAEAAFARTQVSSMTDANAAIGVALDWTVRVEAPAVPWITRLPFARAVRMLGAAS